MENDFFFQSTGNDHIDVVFLDRTQNGAGRIPFDVMNCQSGGKVELGQNLGKLAIGLLVPLANIDQPQLRTEPATDPLSLGQNLDKTRRKCARHRYIPVGNRHDHRD